MANKIVTDYIALLKYQIDEAEKNGSIMPCRIQNVGLMPLL